MCCPIIYHLNVIEKKLKKQPWDKIQCRSVGKYDLKRDQKAIQWYMALEVWEKVIKVHLCKVYGSWKVWERDQTAVL